MKVLFVYRAVGTEKRNSVIAAQAKTLKELQLDLHLYPITKGGLKGYFNGFRGLKAFFKKNQFDIVHAHYGLTAIMVAMAFRGKIVTSIMGSDIYDRNFIGRLVMIFFSKFFWAKTIVKSKWLQEVIKNGLIIPNGIDLELFKPLGRDLALDKTGFSRKEKNIIFIAENLDDNVKNFMLADKAVKSINRFNIQFHTVSGINQEQLVYFYNAADLLLLTSLSEGSPNVIKEAMACNCPIVSTDVGDVKDIIGQTDGCYISSFDSRDVSRKIIRGLEFGKRTNGRESIQHLDSKLIARKIIDIYQGILDRNNDI